MAEPLQAQAAAGREAPAGGSACPPGEQRRGAERPRCYSTSLRGSLARTEGRELWAAASHGRAASGGGGADLALRFLFSLSLLDSTAGDGGILAVAAGLCGVLSATQWLPRLGGFRSMARVAAVGGAAG